MSHGSEENEADPNLTPLLDLVLQLLMFFIINVNFVSEQVNPDITLPQSESARPLDRPIEGDLYLNQKSRSQAYMSRLPESDRERLRAAESIILVTGKSPMSMLEARAWLKEQYERAEKKGTVKDVTIHFRPDGDLEVNELMKLMNACKVAGFQKLQVHAQVGS
jgi:biopolymer transport protein ExbD